MGTSLGELHRGLLDLDLQLGLAVLAFGQDGGELSLPRRGGGRLGAGDGELRRAGVELGAQALRL